MSEKILIVDDEESMADLLEIFLKNDGYTVYKFYNGQDVLNACGDSRLRGLRSRKPIGFRQWVVHKYA